MNTLFVAGGRISRHASLSGPIGVLRAVCSRRMAMSLGCSVVMSLVVGGAVGWLAWGRGTGLVSLLWILVLPLAWGRSSSRLSVFAWTLGYYLAAARGLPGGTAVFFGEGGGFAGVGWVMWVGVSGVLSLPFLLIWTRAQGWARGWRFLVAACVSSVPPLAFIGWVSPLAVAGVMFPGMGFFGLVLCLGLFVALAVLNWRAVLGLLLAGLIVNSVVWSSGNVLTPSGWQGVDTSFPHLSSGGADQAGQVLVAMQRVAWVAEFAKTVPAGSVRVLPETILGSFNAVGEMSLQATKEALALRGSRVLVGAELEQADGRYVNGLLVLGAEEGESHFLAQNIPVPYAMWQPWSSEGAVGNVFGVDNVALVGGQRVASVICYEQLLSFSLLQVMLAKPDVVVAVSNVWWVSGPSIPAIQAQFVSAYARLFGVGVVFSRNS